VPPASWTGAGTGFGRHPPRHDGDGGDDDDDDNPQRPQQQHQFPLLLLPRAAPAAPRHCQGVDGPARERGGHGEGQTPQPHHPQQPPVIRGQEQAAAVRANRTFPLQDRLATKYKARPYDYECPNANSLVGGLWVRSQRSERDAEGADRTAGLSIRGTHAVRRGSALFTRAVFSNKLAAGARARSPFGPPPFFWRCPPASDTCLRESAGVRAVCPYL
jgi:hypothetical protein